MTLFCRKIGHKNIRHQNWLSGGKYFFLERKNYFPPDNQFW